LEGAKQHHRASQKTLLREEAGTREKEDEKKGKEKREKRGGGKDEFVGIRCIQNYALFLSTHSTFNSTATVSVFLTTTKSQLRPATS
jgi:hypothetical protein